MSSQKSGKQKVAGGIPDRDQQVGSINDLAASDLPDKGRGPVETNIGKELGRRLPKDTGIVSAPGVDVGMRGTKADYDLDKHGGRKRN